MKFSSVTNASETKFFLLLEMELEQQTVVDLQMI